MWSKKYKVAACPKKNQKIPPFGGKKTMHNLPKSASLVGTSCFLGGGWIGLWYYCGEQQRFLDEFKIGKGIYV
ncbi:MAG: hypothetical protein JST58_05775 [Bacteroidetes bacterium]|nr:hypothetical protein [Bacteroidota bacterium]